MQKMNNGEWDEKIEKELKEAIEKFLEAEKRRQ